MLAAESVKDWASEESGIVLRAWVQSPLQKESFLHTFRIITDPVKNNQIKVSHRVSRWSEAQKATEACGLGL